MAIVGTAFAINIPDSAKETVMGKKITDISFFVSLLLMLTLLSTGAGGHGLSVPDLLRFR